MALRWRRRAWGDPATWVALIAFVVGLVMIFIDRLDAVLFGASVDFGQWPLLLLGLPFFWFCGFKLGVGVADSDNKGDGP